MLGYVVSSSETKKDSLSQQSNVFLENEFARDHVKTS